MEKNSDPIEQEGEKKEHVNVQQVSIIDEMRRSFIEYSMSVITSRALPDVRDGLKPVHRRILFAMSELNLTHSSKFMKSARVVGAVLGKYHPHGDTSVYEAMVKMAQEFSMRFPLVKGQGNFGSVDGDSAAAMRYTEAKMSKISQEMLGDLEKDTVDFQPNYDGTEKEPKVLPASIPNLLVNGVMGIAVGMATNMPPHNLHEVLDALSALIENKNISIPELMEHLKGPDFPLGGIAYDKKAMLEAYSTGRGGVTTRGLAEIEEPKAGRFQILIRSIPYQVNRANLVVKIADLVREKKIKGIRDLRDESTDVTRIVVDIKTGENPQRILNLLYKKTDLETNFNYNMTALVKGVPRLLSLKDILEQFVIHRHEIVRRRTEFDLRKAQARAHILEGLKKALDHIDEIIKLIKQSKDTPEARGNLMKKYNFSQIQAQAILEMKLQKLAGLERKKIEDELKEKLLFIAECEDLLGSEKKILNVIKEETKAIRDTYKSERRTRIIKTGVSAISDEDLIPQKEAVIVFTAGGYIKRTDPSEYKKQNRGGVGVTGMDTKEEDVITDVFTGDTHSDLMYFTDKGRVFVNKMYDIPESSRNTRGKSVNNYIEIEGEERVNTILPVPKETKEEEGLALVFLTKKGIVKKVDIDAFKNVRRSGMIAIGLKDGDALLEVRVIRPGDDVVLITRNAQSIRFSESDARAMGRTAAGVKAITLKGDDYVIGTGIVPNGKEAESQLLVVSENGYGKRTNLSEYKVQNRGGSGIKTASITSKNGPLVAARVIDKDFETEEDGHEVIAMSQHGQIIRTAIQSIAELGRATQGVRVMKLRKNDDKVASIALL